jgi:hypothetical protein
MREVDLPSINTHPIPSRPMNVFNEPMPDYMLAKRDAFRGWCETLRSHFSLRIQNKCRKAPTFHRPSIPIVVAAVCKVREKEEPLSMFRRDRTPFDHRESALIG